MLLPHTYKKSDLQKNCIDIIPNYLLLHITQSFCVCKPPWVPLPPLTQGQNKFQGGAWNTIRYKNWLEDQMYLF